METQAQVLTFINQSPVFKGLSLLGLGIAALLFVWFMKKKGESLRSGMLIFALISVLLVCYGLWILIFQPQWWLPPR